jgi:hypothetical protein
LKWGYIEVYSLSCKKVETISYYRIKKRGVNMNSKTAHFSAHVLSWVEHEEAILVTLVRKLRNDVDEITDPVVVIGVVVLFAYIFLSVLPQLSQHTQLCSCCDVPPLFSCIW